MKIIEKYYIPYFSDAHPFDRTNKKESKITLNRNSTDE